MFKAIVQLKSESPISFSNQVRSERQDNETYAEHEERTWREKLHSSSGNGKGQAVIPGMMFKKAIELGGKMLGKIPGKGNMTYTKYFLGGVQVVSNHIETPVKVKDVKSETFSVPSDGVKGGGKRVAKTFPVIDDWEGVVEFIITNNEIDAKAFENALNIAGINVGIGRFRPANGGNKGMFSVQNIDFIHFDNLNEVWKSSNGNRKLKK